MSTRAALAAVLVLAAAGAWLWTTTTPRGALRDVRPEDAVEAQAAAAEDVAAPGAAPEQLEEPEDGLRDVLETRAAAVEGAEPHATRTRLRARLVDEATSEALPRYRLSLQQGTRRIELETDGDGALDAEVPFAAGKLALVAHDGRLSAPAAVRELDWDGTADELWWRVPAGPTVRLAWSPPEAAGWQDLRAQLFWKDLEEADRRSAPLVLREPDPEDPLQMAWLRFPPILDEEPAVERLVLRSVDGCWRGENEFRAAQGRAGMQRFALQAFGSLRLVVKTDGQALAQAQVSFVRPDGRTGERRTDAQGVLELGFMPAGALQLRVRHLRCAETSTTVELVAGRRLEHELELLSLPVAGAVEGAIRSDSGMYAQALKVRLRSEAQPELSLVWSGRLPETAAVSKPAKQEARYAFPGLPAGAYTVEIEENDPYEWSPRKRKVAPGERKADFRVRDAVPRADFRFEPRDKNSGERLRRFHLVLDTHEGQRSLWARHGEVVLEDWPLDKPFRWRLDAADHAPERGDSARLSKPAVETGERVVEVPMVFGWGEWVRVLSSRRNAPVAGASVLVDGAEAGKTDKNGMFKVVRRDDPRTLEARFRSWRTAKPADLRSAKDRKWSTIQITLAPQR